MAIDNLVRGEFRNRHGFFRGGWGGAGIIIINPGKTEGELSTSPYKEEPRFRKELNIPVKTHCSQAEIYNRHTPFEVRHLYIIDWLACVCLLAHLFICILCVCFLGMLCALKN